MEANRVKFIVNPRAGRKGSLERTLSLFKHNLKDCNLSYQIELIPGRGEGRRIAWEAVREGYRMIVAVGGDGTIQEIAPALLSSPAILGIVPTGSGNGLARQLSIPLKVEESLEMIVRGTGVIKELDVGRVNGDLYFFSTLGVGFDAYVSRLFNQDPGKRGLGRYFYLTIKALLRYRPPLIRLEFLGRQLAGHFFLVTVANINQYGGGALIAPKASPYDGKLDLCLIENLTLTQFLFHWPQLFRGRIDELPFVQSYQLDSLKIGLDPPGLIQMDGESLSGLGRLQIDLLAGALKVYTPGIS